MIGKILGSRYELIDKIGSGGMSVVYKAKCHLLNRFVAVKMLRDEYITDQDFLEKFRKEAQAAASMSHHNIVNIYDVGSYEDIPYIVMELVNGETLKEYISKSEGFLKNDEIANFSKQIALALEHAHSNQIIHKDIKPHNILVSKDGTLKVADFGIASAISETTTSYSSEAIGSVRYSSPEQARGRNVDERTDLYSLGVLMYEMATRQVPFEGETAVEIALKHMKDDIRQPSEINSTFHKGLESIVTRSLLKNINQRYQSAKELVDDLDKIINNPKENVAFYDFNNEEATQKIPNLDAFKIEKGENRTMKKTTKKRKALVKDKNTLAVIGVVLLAFVTALVIFAVGRMTPNLDEQPTIVELINVVGLPVVEAESALEAQGFNVIVAGAEPNNEYAKGTIYRQSVPAGSKIRPDYKITLYPSAGATKALTPNLIQTTIEDARVKINNTTFVLGTIDYVNDDIDKGYIISQDPSANLEAADDTVINVVVSLGPEYNNAIMPKLRELTLEEAQKIIIEIGLEIDEITYEVHETIEKGAIISQSVAEGTEVDLDSMVSVVVSTGSGEEEGVDPVEGDPNAVTSKKYSISLDDYVGQDVTVKVMYEKDGQFSVIHNQVHSITTDAPAAVVPLEGSGKGTLSIFVNDVLFMSTSVDFSN